MAAGKVDFSRRGVFDVSRRISDCRSGRNYGVCLNGDIKGDVKVELKRDYAKRRETGYGDRDEKGVVGGILDGSPSFDVEDGEIKVRNAEVVDAAHDDAPPPEKRRKLSPILRDKDGKMYVGIHQKNGVVVSEHELDESPVVVHSSFTQLAGCSDEPEPGQLDEEDFSHAPKISTCRWVFDEEEEDRLEKSRMSPQSCFYERERSDGAAGESSGSEHRFGSSSGGECSRSDLVNNDLMEVDDTIEGNPIADPRYSDFENDASGVPVCEPSSRHMLRECRSVYEYERLGKISEGSYGIVYRAKDKASGAMVALKKLKMGVDQEGFPMHYLREINALMSFNHPAIVDVKEVVLDDSSDGLGNVYMVMEYMEHDLKALMGSRKQAFSQSEVKCLMLQLLEGVKYLHDNWVLHRDLKTSNLLLNNKGELKICDFGMARQYGSPLKPYTQLVVTLWYRAPELLLGSNQYSTSVDMWSVGCIMAELLANKPLFDGKTELEQINKIFRTLGTPNEKIWLGYSQLPGSKVNYAQQPYNKLRDKFPRTLFTGSPVLSDLGFDLLSKLLTYDPEKRITVDDALNHDWFREVPLPKSKDFMPTFPVEHARKR